MLMNVGCAARWDEKPPVPLDVLRRAIHEGEDAAVVVPLWPFPTPVAATALPSESICIGGGDTLPSILLAWGYP